MNFAAPTPLLLALALCAIPGPAPGDGWWDPDREHDRARRAREGGEILSLPEVYARVADQLPGRVLETELEREDGLWVYELKILTPVGRLLEVYVDARDGRVIGREED